MAKTPCNAFADDVVQLCGGYSIEVPVDAGEESEGLRDDVIVAVGVSWVRARTRPDRVLADKAYSSRANRAYLRRRGIACTIPPAF